MVLFLLGWSQRYRIFLFPRESSWLIHSFKIQNSVFFFSKNPEKKKYSPFFQYFAVFFFFLPKKKFMCHSFNRSRGCFFFFRRRKKKKTAFSFIQSIFSKSVYKMNFRREKKNTVPLGIQVYKFLN